MAIINSGIALYLTFVRYRDFRITGGIHGKKGTPKEFDQDTERKSLKKKVKNDLN